MALGLITFAVCTFPLGVYVGLDMGHSEENVKYYEKRGKMAMLRLLYQKGVISKIEDDIESYEGYDYLFSFKGSEYYTHEHNGRLHIYVR